jgi:hypothetical protein
VAALDTIREGPTFGEFAVAAEAVTDWACAQNANTRKLASGSKERRWQARVLILRAQDSERRQPVTI